jgi:hypothetical protein
MDFAKRVTCLTLAVGAMAGTVSAIEPMPSLSIHDERFEYTFDAIERLSEDDLKEFYLRCTRAAMRERLGSGEIALCSTGYERLKKSAFRGDFRALVEWRRSVGRPAEPLPSPF